MGSTSKARRLVAVAYQRVLDRNMAAGRSLSYEQLLAETSTEVDVLLDLRRERDAQSLRQAREYIRKAEVKLAGVAEARAAGDAARQLADLEAVPGPPSWHPEHSGNDL